MYGGSWVFVKPSYSKNEPCSVLLGTIQRSVSSTLEWNLLMV